MSRATARALEIQNVVATVRIASVLALDELAKQIPAAQFDKTKFPELILRISSPKVVALLFARGKIVLTGMPHPDEFPAAFSGVLEVLRAAGVELEPFELPRIVNIVSSGSFDEGIALQRLAIAINLEHIEYEPEVFPGLVYRRTSPSHRPRPAWSTSSCHRPQPGAHRIRTRIISQSRLQVRSRPGRVDLRDRREVRGPGARRRRGDPRHHRRGRRVGADTTAPPPNRS